MVRAAVAMVGVAPSTFVSPWGGSDASVRVLMMLGAPVWSMVSFSASLSVLHYNVVQRTLYNPATLGTSQSVLIRGVASFQEVDLY